MLGVRNVSVILILTFVLTIYLKQVPSEIDKRQNYNSNLMKKIVAYSLRKQIEIEGNIMVCEMSEWYGEYPMDFGMPNSSSFFVYSAHEDRRLKPYTYIRILGMVKGNLSEPLFCNIKTSTQLLYSTKATSLEIWSDSWLDPNRADHLTPVLISCRLPVGDDTTTEIYLHKKPCRTGSKTLIYSRSHRKTASSREEVAVCVKPLNFDADISKRLVKWIEICKILGAGRFNVYVNSVHPNVMEVLKFYESNKFNVISLANNNKSHKALWQRRKEEILLYNHCFYNHLDVGYVLPIDIDEIIIPREKYKWQDLFSDFPEYYASYSIRNAYYFTNKSFSLDSYQRTELSPEGESGKSFVSTKNALTVFNHYALHGLKPGISRTYFVPDTLAQMNHYRSGCSVNILPECVKYLSSPKIFDNIIVKYKKILESNFMNVIKYVRIT